MSGNKPSPYATTCGPASAFHEGCTSTAHPFHVGLVAGTSVTREGDFGGSPLFMPPEQCTTYDEVDERADIYALGCVAYFLLTGTPPFDGRNPVEVMLHHTNSAVAPPSRLAPGIPADLECIVLRCLEKNPADRFQDVLSLERALAACACADQWTEAKAKSWWQPVEEPQSSGQANQGLLAPVFVSCP